MVYAPEPWPRVPGMSSEFSPPNEQPASTIAQEPNAVARNPLRHIVILPFRRGAAEAPATAAAGATAFPAAAAPAHREHPVTRAVRVAVHCPRCAVARVRSGLRPAAG